MIKLLIIATFYANSFIGKYTASGDIFSQTKYTCATLMYPIGTILLVENIINGNCVTVIVNDRCKKRGIVDLSKIAFTQISNLKNGRAKVKITRKN
jgi:rare lipoprotein A